MIGLKRYLEKKVLFEEAYHLLNQQRVKEAMIEQVCIKSYPNPRLGI